MHLDKNWPESLNLIIWYNARFILSTRVVFHTGDTWTRPTGVLTLPSSTPWYNQTMNSLFTQIWDFLSKKLKVTPYPEMLEFTLLYGLFILKSLSLHYSMFCLFWNVWVYTTLCFVCSEMFEFTLLYGLFIQKSLSLHYSMVCLFWNLWIYTTSMVCLSCNVWFYTTLWFVYPECLSLHYLRFVYPEKFMFKLLYTLFTLL